MYKFDRILLAHGGGGKLSQELLQEVILKEFNNRILADLDDAAVILWESTKIAITTDSFVVNPIFFKGGDIGKLSICGTVNDLAMMGAIPRYLTASFIIEEGLPLKDFEKILISMRKAAGMAGVMIVAGDTKVVGAGNADKIFINTTGIGYVPPGINISSSNARPGDVVIINGFIGDHGIAILDQREGLNLAIPVESDCAPLNRLVEDILKITNKIHTLRDPTRGGLSSALNEIARKSRVKIILEEELLPIREAVKAACDLLGFDPLYVANEGKVLVFCPENIADKVLESMKKNEYGRDSAIIGRVVKDDEHLVILNTIIGGSRIVDMMVGDQLPRIC